MYLNFFGLTDSLYVKRRQGIDREVHICRIGREQAMEYLVEISDRLAVLYGYNPNQKHILKRTRLRIFKEQLEYERNQLARLEKARTTDKKFRGANARFYMRKTEENSKIRTRNKRNRRKQRRAIIWKVNINGQLYPSIK